MNPRIYTRSGDRGETSLLTGRRVSKASLRVEAYGSVDELNAAVGLARAEVEDEWVDSTLLRIQGDLFTIDADMASPNLESKDTLRRVTRKEVEWLEETIDRVQEELKPLKHFILPAGSKSASILHLARTICRRAERRAVALSEKESLNSQVIVYLNRLSDLLFVLARLANKRMGVEEQEWTPS